MEKMRTTERGKTFVAVVKKLFLELQAISDLSPDMCHRIPHKRNFTNYQFWQFVSHHGNIGGRMKCPKCRVKYIFWANNRNKISRRVVN